MNKKINNTGGMQDWKRFWIISSVSIILGALSFLLDHIILIATGLVQNRVVTYFFYSITLLGETYVFAGIAVLLTLILIINKKPFLAFIATVCVNTEAIFILKMLINRPRPFEHLGTTSIIATQLSSFPSGHAMMFFSIIPIMVKNFPRWKPVFWTVAILVGLSRIYLGVHYFSDVVWGAIIGYGIGYLFMKLGDVYDWRYGKEQ